MNGTLHTLALEVLKAKNDLKSLSTTETHSAYREIYAELKQAEKDFVKSNPDEKRMS